MEDNIVMFRADQTWLTTFSWTSRDISRRISLDYSRHCGSRSSVGSDFSLHVRTWSSVEAYHD